MAAITISELLVGAHRAETIERRLRREEFADKAIAIFDVFPFDIPIARVHSQLAASLQVAGRTVGAHDLLIAAIAHGYRVLTHNLRDFGRISGLEVVQV